MWKSWGGNYENIHKAGQTKWYFMPRLTFPSMYLVLLAFFYCDLFLIMQYYEFYLIHLDTTITVAVFRLLRQQMATVLVLHPFHSSVLLYRKHASLTLEHFGWTFLWKKLEVRKWLTKMTSPDQSEEWGPCRPCPVVRDSHFPLVTREKAYIPEQALHQMTICNLAIFHNNNPKRLEKEEMKVSGTFLRHKTDSAVQK